MDEFKEYMDRIKAEDELKERTKNFVHAGLAKIAENQAVEHAETSRAKEAPFGRKFRMATAVAAACMIFTIGGYAYYNTPVDYVSVDVNPSVELGVNAFERVVEAEGLNEDGAALIDGQSFNNMTLEEAAFALVREAARQGFVEQDGSTVIAVTAGSNDDEKADRLRARSEQGAQSAIQAGNLKAVVYSDCTNLQIRDKASDSGLSTGKYKLISILQALDPEIDIEQYKNVKMTDIILKANELLADADIDFAQRQEYQNAFSQIEKAAIQIRETNRYREMNRNGTPDGDGSDSDQDLDSEQNQIQNQEQNQEQNKVQNNTGGPDGAAGNEETGGPDGAAGNEATGGPDGGSGSGSGAGTSDGGGGGQGGGSN